jgi:hypothetical protein
MRTANDIDSRTLPETAGNIQQSGRHRQNPPESVRNSQTPPIRPKPVGNRKKNTTKTQKKHDGNRQTPPESARIRQKPPDTANPPETSRKPKKHKQHTKKTRRKPPDTARNRQTPPDTARHRQTPPEAGGTPN